MIGHILFEFAWSMLNCMMSMMAVPGSIGSSSGGVAGLSISTFEHLSQDDNDSEWADVSWRSPLFVIDMVSMAACFWEGFSDFLFITLQYQRPNGGEHLDCICSNLAQL